MHYESHKYPSLFQPCMGMKNYVGVGIATLCLAAAASFLSARVSSSALPDGGRLQKGWKFEHSTLYSPSGSAAEIWKPACGGFTDIANCEMLPHGFQLEWRGAYQAVLDSKGKPVGYLRHQDPVVDKVSSTSNVQIIEMYSNQLGGRSELREFVPLERRF